jgi:tRNA (Thr-GGU) A37 N-methylase
MRHCAVHIEPIGVVEGGRAEPIDDNWADVEAAIVLDERFPTDALAGLADFSHVDVVFVFHLVDEGDVYVGARAYRLAEGRDLRPARQGAAQPHRRDHV